MHTTADRAVELRPPPVLAVGVAGFCDMGLGGEQFVAVTEALDAIIKRLAGAFRTIVAAERSCFSDAPPTVRILGMAAEAAALSSIQMFGAEVACLLPFVLDHQRHDFSSPAGFDRAQTAIAKADALFVLSGDPAEGARAWERANNVLLANVDLLIAVWNGERAARRAGTGDVVQAAVSSGIPVIVLDPSSPAHPRLLIYRGDHQLEHPVATDLRQEPLNDDLCPLLFRLVAPPSGTDKRQGLHDLYREEHGRRIARFEYPFLLKLFRVGRTGTRAARVAEPSTAGTAANGLHSEESMRELNRRMQTIDGLSTHYGRLFRSSSASAFLLIIFAALLSASLSILFPSIFGVWIVGQVVVNALVLIDASICAKRRWHERWLDYRLIAERLRCLRFLHPLGLGLDRMPGGGVAPKQSWVEWYVRRCERGLGAPAKEMQPEDIARAMHQLAGIVQEQVSYHRHASRQYELLQRRLAFAARLALRATIAVVAVVGIGAYVFADLVDVTWKSFALVLLFALPAAAGAFNGVRAEADLVRLAERSATAAVALARLRRVILTVAPTYDRVALGAMRAAAVMGAELSDWRFVLERRRARARRPQLGASRT